MLKIDPNSEWTIYYAIQEKINGEWETIATFNYVIYTVEELKENYLPHYPNITRLVRVTKVIEVL